MAYIGAKRALLGGKGIRWLLRDEFDGVLAAGAVNGTKATPGPGTRTIIDTENKLSVSGGNLVWAKHTEADADNSWLVYTEGITRTAGQVCIIKTELTSTGQFFTGLGSSTVEQLPSEGAAQFRCQGASAVVRAIIDSLWNLNLGYTFPAVNNAVYIAFVLRTAGCYVFYKQSSNWLLINFDNLVTGTTTPLYLYWANIASIGAASAGKLDFMRAVKKKWLPSPLAYDTFTRANGAIGSTEATGADGQTAPVKVWTGATWTIATNTAVNTPTLGATLDSGTLTIGAWYKIVASEENHFFTGSVTDDCFRAAAETALDGSNTVKQITLSTMLATFDSATKSTISSVLITLAPNKQASGLVTNLDSAGTPANFLIAYHDGTNARLEKCVAGTYTSLINAAAAYSVAGELRLDLRRDGADLKAQLFYRRAVIGTEQTISDASIIDNTLCGIMSTNPSNSLVIYKLLPRGEEGQYNAFLNKAAK